MGYVCLLTLMAPKKKNKTNSRPEADAGGSGAGACVGTVVGASGDDVQAVGPPARGSRAGGGHGDDGETKGAFDATAARA